MNDNLIIKKRYTFLNKIYYYLVLNGKIIGKAWITKKYRFLFNGLYIKINEEYRRKGYGKEFYKLLTCELGKRGVEEVTIWVNNDSSAVHFFDKVVDRYADRLKFMNKIGFVETLIVE